MYNTTNAINTIEGLGVFIIIIIIWDLFWRGKALWTSARNSQKYWFIALLIVNSLGILPIIYLLFFQCDCNAGKKKKS